MRRFQFIYCLVGIILSTASCSRNNVDFEPIEDPDIINPDMKLGFIADIEYAHDESDFLNPERGMYITNGYNLRNNSFPTAMSSDDLRKRVRNAGMTLSFSEFYLDYYDREFPSQALELIGQVLANHREAGVKTIVRFVYNETEDRHDAPLDIVLKHIEQVKPILQQYSDIIYVFQAGFVGACGEWCNSTYFNTWEQKKQVVNALLDAVPASRQIELRTPSIKMNILGIKSIKDTLTRSAAFNGSDVSRIGGHNDCFMANGNDAGTYGSSMDRKYWKNETKYTIMGGETCLADPTYCNCNAGYSNVEDFHWSYLNSAYNVNALKILDDEGCFNDIRKRLGYRLYLNKAAFEGIWEPGAQIHAKFSITNEGFASLMNPRAMEFIIESEDRSETYIIPLDTDPRHWQGGSTTLWEEHINLPDSLKKGKKYHIYINMPDPEKTLHDKPEFSVRLANINTWDKARGFNYIYSFSAE